MSVKGSTLKEMTIQNKFKIKKTQYIFYSEGNKSTDQIWRIRPDGTEVFQITYDLDHVWFPQVSPNGKWVAFLSFPLSTNPNGPAKNQRVNLKIVPTEGGAPKTVAYFYGSKGSLGTYAWSPNGTSFVFVSYGE